MKINKKFLKIFIMLLIFVLMSMFLHNYNFAWEMNLEKYENASAGRAGNTVTSIVGAVINLTSTIGAGVAIIMLIFIGVQYLSKGAEGKAEAKKDLTGYIMGVVILFGVSGILKLIQMFINANVNNV